MVYAVADRLGEEVISSDIVRKKLANISLRDNRVTDFRKGIYSEHFTENTYRQSLKEGPKLLQHGKSVILEATFLDPWHKEAAQKLVESLGARFFILLCQADEATVLACLHRRQNGKPLSDVRVRMYLEQKLILKPVAETLPGSLVRLNTGALLQEVVDEVVRLYNKD